MASRILHTALLWPADAHIKPCLGKSLNTLCHCCWHSVPRAVVRGYMKSNKEPLLCLHKTHGTAEMTTSLSEGFALWPL